MKTVCMENMSKLSYYSELSQKLGFHSVENRVIQSISYTE